MKRCVHDELAPRKSPNSFSPCIAHTAIRPWTRTKVFRAYLRLQHLLSTIGLNETEAEENV